MRAALALLLAVSLVAGPGVTVARASTPIGASTDDIPGLKRTNQVLSALIAFLKLLDELREMPDMGGPSAPMPPPIGTGHPGPVPGPLPMKMPAGGETS